MKAMILAAGLDAPASPLSRDSETGHPRPGEPLCGHAMAFLHEHGRVVLLNFPRPGRSGEVTAWRQTDSR